MASSYRSVRLLGRSMPQSGSLSTFSRSVATTARRTATSTTSSSSTTATKLAASTARPAASTGRATTASSISASRAANGATAAASPPTSTTAPSPSFKTKLPPEERPSYVPPSSEPPLPTIQTPLSPSPENPTVAEAPRNPFSSHSMASDPVDWSTSYHGLSTNPFPPEVATKLMAPIPFNDVEVKPDGIIYLPEIKYRRILNSAFGPGGWGLAPRGELTVENNFVTREFALIVHGRFVALARGECSYYGDENLPNAIEGCKSNALMRCCKDLGIASELWDPRYIRKYLKDWTKEVWVEYVPTKKKRMIRIRKDDEVVYPYKLTTSAGLATGTGTAAR